MYRTPTHLGIIPDGNRRWAARNGLNRADGYEYGLLPAVRLLREAKKHSIKELTYYGFTVDNCKRPKEQVSAFTKACCKAVKILEGEDVSVCIVGNTKSACFPTELLPYTKRENQSADKTRVNILVNYGWEWDIKNGWLSRDIPRIDMVIRWGGMCRLSGFFANTDRVFRFLYRKRFVAGLQGKSA